MLICVAMSFENIASDEIVEINQLIKTKQSIIKPDQDHKCPPGEELIGDKCRNVNKRYVGIFYILIQLIIKFRIKR